MPLVDMRLEQLKACEGRNPRPTDHDACRSRALAEMAAVDPHAQPAVFPFLCDYRRLWEMDLAARAYEELAWHFRAFDPRHGREAETGMAVGLMDDIVYEYLAAL